MTAYCVGRIRIKDAAAWELYRSQVGATIAQFGGEVMFRGGLQQVLSGAGDHDSVVAIRFENIEAAKRWHDSPEYQSLVPVREQGAEVSLVLYEG